MDQALNKIATVPLHRKCFNHLGTLGNDITVQQLLDHRKGFNRDASGSLGHVVFEMRQISQKLGSNSPPSIQDFVAYMLGFRLDFTPDIEYQYSNVGYVILSAVVEHISGQKYFDYPKSTILACTTMSKCGIPIHPSTSATESPKSPATLASAPSTQIPIPFSGHLRWRWNVQRNRRRAFQPRRVRHNSRQVSQQPWYLFPFGGNCRARPNPPCGRYGEDSGAGKFVASRADGVDYAMNINTIELFNAGDTDFRGLAEGTIAALLNTNPTA